MLEGAFDQLFALVADFVNVCHCLDDAGCGTGEGEFTFLHFALIQGERTVSKHHEAALFEFALFIFVEIEDDFFIRKLVITDFYLSFRRMIVFLNDLYLAYLVGQ